MPVGLAETPQSQQTTSQFERDTTATKNADWLHGPVVRGAEAFLSASKKRPSQSKTSPAPKAERVSVDLCRPLSFFPPLPLDVANAGACTAPNKGQVQAQAPPAPKAELLGDSYRALSSSPPPRLSPKAPTTTLVNKLLVCKTGGTSSNNIGQRMRTLLPPPPPFHVKEMRSIPKTKPSQAPTLAPDTRFDGQLQTQSSTSIGFQGGHEHTMIRPSSCMSSHEIGSPGKGVKAEEDIGDFKKKTQQN